jgi:RNA polymerase sigma factor (sigma-70 family)
MDARPRPDARDDAQLVRAATTGDRGAFAAIYDRYADRLHDFCWSVLRDRDEAADATQDAFLVAAERLGQLRDPERLRPWLYAVARSQAMRRVRARSRVVAEEPMTDLPDPSSGPEQAAERADLRRLVWSAAAGLSERDRALLDLHLRHGLEGAELGEAMGVEPGHAYVLLSRLRDQVERSLGALLVARLGRDDCPELAGVLAGWDGRFSPLIRKRVARHVDACAACGTRRRALASPLALLSAVPPLPAPVDLRSRVLDRVQLPSGPGSSPEPGAPQPDPPKAGPPVGERSRLAEPGAPAVHTPGFPSSDARGPDAGGPSAGGAAARGPLSRKGRRRGALVGFVVALLVAAGVGVGLGWERGPAAPGSGAAGSPVVAGAATSTAGASPSTSATSGSTSSSATTGTTATTVPATPADLAVSPAGVDLGASGTTARLTLRNGGDEPLSWTAAASAPWLRVSPAGGRLDGGGQASLSLSASRDGLPEGDAEGRVQLAWGGPTRAVAVGLRVERAPEIGGLSASPSQLRVGPCIPTTALVEATVTDASALSSVTLRWGGPEVPMSPRGGSWFARLGPVPDPGMVPWQVAATDARGNTATAAGPPVSVLGCP